jgi:hypothetical protein
VLHGISRAPAVHHGADALDRDDIAQRILVFSAFALSDTGRRPMSESTAMDLRLPIGLLFLVLGVILADFGVLMPGVARRASSRRPPRGA